MKTPVWVLDETILAFHEQLLAAFGGAAGVRDNARLESALTRPKNVLAYGEPTLFELAASYAHGLVKNHPFVDGNKRIGFAVAVLFLELNGVRFSANEVDAVVQTLALATGELKKSAFAAWLQASSAQSRSKRRR